MHSDLLILSVFIKILNFNAVSIYKKCFVWSEKKSERKYALAD